MPLKEMIKQEIDKLPEPVLKEIFEFIRFLEYKKGKKCAGKGIAGVVHCIVSKGLG